MKFENICAYDKVLTYDLISIFVYHLFVLTNHGGFSKGV